MDELERIDAYCAGQTPPEMPVRLEATAANPQEVLDRIKQVMRLIAARRDDEDPERADWRTLLPDWFTASFDHSLEEIEANPDLWDFDSWVMMAFDCDLVWWSSAVAGGAITVNLCAGGWPYAPSCLLFLLRAAGAEDAREVEF